MSLFPTCPSADSALLLATLHSLDPLCFKFLSSIIHTAVTTTQNRLTILLFSRLFNSSDSSLPGISRTHYWDDVQRLLTYVYVQATKVAQDLDKILMDIDVLLLGIDSNIPQDLGKHFDIVFRVAGGEHTTHLSLLKILPIFKTQSLYHSHLPYLPFVKLSSQPPILTALLSPLNHPKVQVWPHLPQLHCHHYMTSSL